MEIGTFVAASIAGGVGAVLRWVVDVVITRRTRSSFPLGVWIVNVSGSFALGIVVALLAADPLGAVIGAGLLGGYTTFSTVAVTSVTLTRAGEWRTAIVNVVGTFAACVLAAAVGVAAGGALSG